MHFLLCTEPEEGKCEPNEEDETLQYLIGIAVPKGAVAPASVTAQPTTPGTQPIVFTRNDQVAAEIAAASAVLAESELAEKGLKPWPPAGLEGIGYLSATVQEHKGATGEWAVDAEFGIPVFSDGSPFTGPFATGVAEGSRQVTPGHPADAPVHCWRFASPPEEGEAFCFPTIEEAQTGTSGLGIGAPPTSTVFLGGNVSLPFALNFGSTAGSLPSFTLSASSNLPGAAVALSSATFAPPAPDPTTHRSSGADTVTLTVPSNAKPGIYEVTLTAKDAQGASATQVAKIEVTKPKLKVGKVKLNKGNGTAKLSIGVPSAGTLTVSGKTIAKVKRTAKGAKTIKVTIKAKGKAKVKLSSTGKAKVKAKIVFKPANGASVTKTKSITLKKKLG